MEPLAIRLGGQTAPAKSLVMPRYPEYKDSGIDWLGEVPEHWDVKSIKWLSPVQRGASPRPIDDPKYFDDEGEYAWVRIADVSASDGELRDTTQRLSDLGSSLSVKINPGELFISIAGTVGKPCISAIKACIHDGFVYFPTLQIPPIFLYRIFEAGVCYGGLGKFGTQLNLNTDTIGSIRIALPPTDELNAILTFLDCETGKIDALIAEQRRLVELLAEKRQAVISHAVTKGLGTCHSRAGGNPAKQTSPRSGQSDCPAMQESSNHLDSRMRGNDGVAMKDSGIAWLGEVPVHWEVFRLGTLFQEFADEGQADRPILSVSIHDGVSDRELDDKEMDRKVTRSEDRGKYKSVEPGDLVYNMMRAWQGGFGTVQVQGMVSPAYVVARPRYPFSTAFIEQQLRSPQAIEEMRRHSRGVTDFRLRLYWDEFKSISVVMAPSDEQNAIAAFLATETAKFDALTLEAQRAIELLQERRSALISAAVTGKIDVRGIQTLPQ
jgi:type I restriction enzyme S subunit